jgi:hypothetical protein
VTIIEHTPPLFKFFADERLTWWEEIGVGFYPVKAGIAPYDENYWERYRAMASTPIGLALNTVRVNLVARHYSGPLIDVGIGSGAFIEKRGWRTFGFDVNPHAQKWLVEQNKFWNVHNGVPLPAVSFWDVLEHIPEFPKLISAVQEFVFISIPIFENAAHVLRSKHYRKDEHIWYFTAKGLAWTFDQLGFELVEENYHEELCGREDIGSFAFRRKV